MRLAVRLQIHRNVQCLAFLLVIAFSFSLPSAAIEIGFTVPRINHTEQFAQYDTIINKSLVSEQTFEVQIRIVSPTSHIGQRAIQGEDFDIGAVNGMVIQRLTPREQVIHFAYRIIEDNTPENQEVFQLSVTPVINTPSFGCNITNGCYQQIEIVIEDNDGGLCVHFSDYLTSTDYKVVKLQSITTS